MKKFFNSILCIFLFSILICNVHANMNVTVTVDGKAVDFTEQSPLLINDRTYIPIRGVFEKMGKSVDWSEDDKSVHISDDNESIILKIGKNEMLVSNAIKELDAAPVIVNDKALIPIRAAAEEFGASVDWLALEQQVMITTPEHIESIKNQEHYIGDEYRLNENSLVDCGNCFALNNSYLFKPVAVSDESAIEYAEIINEFAEKLPDANVYNMLLIDSNELYAPTRFYTGQKRATELVNSNLSEKVIPIPAIDNLVNHGAEKIYFSTDHHWTHLGAYYAWETFAQLKGFNPINLNELQRADTDAFSGSYVQRMTEHLVPDELVKTEVMERYLPKYETEVSVFGDMEMTQLMGKVPLINEQNNSYSCFISGDHPLAVIKSSVANGKKLVIIKESFGNALATWAVNDYEYVYVVDIRGFKGGAFSISEFYKLTGFDDLVIESYPTTVASNDLRKYIKEMVEE